jgi:hypothetical protein
MLRPRAQALALALLGQPRATEPGEPGVEFTITKANKAK